MAKVKFVFIVLGEFAKSIILTIKYPPGGWEGQVFMLYQDKMGIPLITVLPFVSNLSV